MTPPSLPFWLTSSGSSCYIISAGNITNQTQEAQVYSHNGPIRRRKRGNILTVDRLEASRFRSRVSRVLTRAAEYATAICPEHHALDLKGSASDGWHGLRHADRWSETCAPRILLSG
eukprot:3737688-Pyramimonas_sp.AAC.1